ncbi:MAG TPA: RsmD family RNA methyltransferase [Thermoanaerobaculia bacterium]|nr:RsmD family RNA methyltransferase [Thermoanaerobaculia bacterium]
MNGTLRVVGGSWRNRRLAVAPGSRPTSERAREALFDILGEWIRGRRVLELFAGSGAVALEALSRGAASAAAVDRDPRAASANAGALGAALEVIGADAAAAVRRLASSGRAFDLVFVDPPYGEETVSAAGVASLVGSEGRMIWQSDAGEEPAAPPGWRVARVARYGRNVFTFLERE